MNENLESEIRAYAEKYKLNSDYIEWSKYLRLLESDELNKYRYKKYYFKRQVKKIALNNLNENVWDIWRDEIQKLSYRISQLTEETARKHNIGLISANLFTVCQLNKYATKKTDFKEYHFL